MSTARVALPVSDKVFPLEPDRARELSADGVVRQIWRRGNLAAACFVVEDAGLHDVQADVNGLPMATWGLSEFEVIPLQPYPGFRAPLTHGRLAAQGELRHCRGLLLTTGRDRGSHWTDWPVRCRRGRSLVHERTRVHPSVNTLR